MQVPGAGLEPVGGGGQGAHRADLDGVAREVGAEGKIGEGVHLGVVAAVPELDERVAGDLVGEAGAAGAEDAPLPVQQHQVGDRDRLLEVPLLLDEAALSGTVGHGLVLEGTLASLVADRAVEGMIDEEELEDALLGLLGHLR